MAVRSRRRTAPGLADHSAHVGGQPAALGACCSRLAHGFSACCEQLLCHLLPKSTAGVNGVADWRPMPSRTPLQVYELSLEEFSLGDARPAVRDIRVRRWEAVMR